MPKHSENLFGLSRGKIHGHLITVTTLPSRASSLGQVEPTGIMFLWVMDLLKRTVKLALSSPYLSNLGKQSGKEGRSHTQAH